MRIGSAPYRPPPVIRGVHFLVHPLYSGDPRIMRLSDDRVRSSMLTRSINLSKRCKTVATELSPHSVVCMFIHMAQSFLDARCDEYADTLRGFITSMESELGARLFVTYGYRGDISARSYEAAYHLTNRVLASGFDVDKEAKAYAYGESFGFCVRESAIVMRDVWAFPNPIRIMVRLTDMWQKWFCLNDFSRDLLLKRNEPHGLVVEEGLPKDVG